MSISFGMFDKTLTCFSMKINENHHPGHGHRQATRGKLGGCKRLWKCRFAALLCGCLELFVVAKWCPSKVESSSECLVKMRFLSLQSFFLSALSFPSDSFVCQERLPTVFQLPSRCLTDWSLVLKTTLEETTCSAPRLSKGFKAKWTAWVVSKPAWAVELFRAVSLAEFAHGLPSEDSVTLYKWSLRNCVLIGSLCAQMKLAEFTRGNSGWNWRRYMADLLQVVPSFHDAKIQNEEIIYFECSATGF